VLSGEATHTNVIIFGLIRSGLEPTIYRTRGEHAKHYTTDAVYKEEKKCNREREVINWDNTLSLYDPLIVHVVINLNLFWITRIFDIQLISGDYVKLTCSCHDIAEKLLSWR
jgi:hypothetical protein